jgi:dipeptidyl aminopeptidase/acylaminoacyl peptidase
MREYLLASLILVVALAACAPVAPQPSAVPPTPTFVPTPSITPTPTPSPTATSTSTPTPTPFPMSIAALRQRSYPGSDIVIEKELDPGVNYRRYYAYYLSEGLKIYALLTVPDGDMPPGGWPAIVFNHGYIPPDVYRTTERYIAYVDTLARHGYIVFRIDYRGHDQSEGEARGAYSDPGYTVDVLNALASLERFPQANPDKMGMWGHSMGGYLTLRAMVISPDIKAGVIWSGVVGSYPEMLYNWRRSSSGTTAIPSPGARSWRNDWVARFGTPEENPAFWDSISASSYLADLSGPLQLHHATTDEEVPVEFSIRLAELGREAGQEVDLFTYEDDNHNIANHFSTAMARTVEFFDEYLK